MQQEVTVVALAGCFDAQSAGQMDSSLQARFQESVEKLVVDIGRVEYVSSAGLRVLLAAARPLGLVLPVLAGGVYGGKVVLSLGRAVQRFLDKLARGRTRVAALHDCDVVDYGCLSLARLVYPLLNPALERVLEPLPPGWRGGDEPAGRHRLEFLRRLWPGDGHPRPGLPSEPG